MAGAAVSATPTRAAAVRRTRRIGADATRERTTAHGTQHPRAEGAESPHAGGARSCPDELDVDAGELGVPAAVEAVRNRLECDVLRRRPEGDPADDDDPLGDALDEHGLAEPVEQSRHHDAAEEEDDPEAHLDLVMARERPRVAQPA